MQFEVSNQIRELIAYDSKTILYINMHIPHNHISFPNISMHITYETSVANSNLNAKVSLIIIFQNGDAEVSRNSN